MFISNETKSLPKTIKVNGVEVKKMPCGKYFNALQTLKDLPEDFIKELSKDGQDFKLSEMFTMENIMNLITKLMIIAPKFLFGFLPLPSVNPAGGQYNPARYIRIFFP